MTKVEKDTSREIAPLNPLETKLYIGYFQTLIEFNTDIKYKGILSNAVRILNKNNGSLKPVEDALTHTLNIIYESKSAEPIGIFYDTGVVLLNRINPGLADRYKEKISGSNGR